MNLFPLDTYVIAGNPVAQSKSPFIHTTFAAATGQTLNYQRLQPDLDAGGFARAVDAFRAQGGKGMNITAPFKLDAFAYATQCNPRAQLAGAANALKFEGEQVIADNFDGIGLVRDIVRNLGIQLKGKRVLMLGAGGAARGAVQPFLNESPALFVLANRTLAKAQDVVAPYAVQGFAVQACGYEALQGADFSAFDVVLNATSSSLRAELPAVPTRVFGAHTVAYDLSYGKGLTPFLKLAQESGAAQLADGVGMLVEQAAEAFEWWRGVRPATSAVIAAMTVPLV